MIYFVDASGNVVSSIQSNDLDIVTSMNGGVYAVQVDDATSSHILTTATNSTLQIQNLVVGQPNKFGLATATGTLATVAIPSATLLSSQRAAINDKYADQITAAREKLRCAIDENKPTTTINNYRTTLQTLLNNKNTELAGVH